jgi:hypothetical protein
MASRPRGRSQDKPRKLLEARFAPSDLIVADAETGTHIRLNTRTVVERAEARGDVGIGGAASSSAAVHALPRLALDVEKSAELHMFVEAQRQRMIEAVKLAEKAEEARREVVESEPMQWRRKRLRKGLFEERLDAHKTLEKLRSEQELELLRKARELGLLG